MFQNWTKISKKPPMPTSSVRGQLFLPFMCASSTQSAEEVGREASEKPTEEWIQETQRNEEVGPGTALGSSTCVWHGVKALPAAGEQCEPSSLRHRAQAPLAAFQPPRSCCQEVGSACSNSRAVCGGGARIWKKQKSLWQLHQLILTYVVYQDCSLLL